MGRGYQIAIAGLIFFGLGLLTGVLGTRLTEHTPIDWPASAKAVGDSMTAIGIVVAGIWAIYLIQRRRSLEARAELTHRWQVWQRGNENLLRFCIDIRNPSEVALQPGDGATRIQQPPAGDKFDCAKGATDNWTDIAKIHHWLSSEGVYIEPKEFETLCHDVKLPPGLRYVQLETIVACKRTDKMRDFDDDTPETERELGDDDERWTLITLVDLEAPTKPQGASTPA
jgi:hypothetical protein